MNKRLDANDFLRAHGADALRTSFAEDSVPFQPNGRGDRATPASDGDRRTSRFFSASSLDEKLMPPREWLVPHLAPMDAVTLFAGDGGVGKSLAALQFAVAAVAGDPWLGRWVRRGPAIYFSGEDDEDELHRRLHDVLIATGRSFSDLAGLSIRSVAGEDALLAVEGPTSLVETELFRDLERRATDEKPVLIVIDTLADVYPSNENDRAKARQFVTMLRGLARRQHCAVVLLGHPSLTGMSTGSGTSGSTAWNNSVRSRLYLSRVIAEGYEADANRRILSTKKSNYGPAGEEIGLTWRGGVFVADPEPSGIEQLTATAKAERVFLALLDAFTSEGRRVNAAGGTSYAPTVFAAHPSSEGVTKRAFTSAMNALLSRGEVRLATSGPPSKRRQHLERSGRIPADEDAPEEPDD